MPLALTAASSLSDTRRRLLQNRRNTPGRIELMKYNKYLRKYTLHREMKVSVSVPAGILVAAC